jgi:serine/threonine protein phosphatase PrpC
MNVHSAIIKGPEKDHLQDAIGQVNQKSFNLLIVADGLGSAKNSAFGAKKAIAAVKKAMIEWRKLVKKDDKVLIQLIHFNWNLLINDSEFEKKDCLTTCLFAYIDKVGKFIILGQLGDGLLFFKSNNQKVYLRSDDDYNFTKSLGNSKSYSDWSIKKLDFDSKEFNLLITTDGVSEDLVEGKENEFLEILIHDMAVLKKNKRNNYLNNLLEKWPTKYHTDDKTIFIAWEKKRG